MSIPDVGPADHHALLPLEYERDDALLQFALPVPHRDLPLHRRPLTLRRIPLPLQIGRFSTLANPNDPWTSAELQQAFTQPNFYPRNYA